MANPPISIHHDAAVTFGSYLDKNNSPGNWWSEKWLLKYNSLFDDEDDEHDDDSFILFFPMAMERTTMRKTHKVKKKKKEVENAIDGSTGGADEGARTGVGTDEVLTRRSALGLQGSHWALGHPPWRVRVIVSLLRGSYSCCHYCCCE